MRMGGWTAALAIAAVAASAGSSNRARDGQANSRRHRVDVVVYRWHGGRRDRVGRRGAAGAGRRAGQPGSASWRNGVGRARLDGLRPKAGYRRLCPRILRASRPQVRARLEWHFEPHVAEAVFNDLIADARVRCSCEQRLREQTGIRQVRYRGRRAIETETRRGLRGRRLHRRELRR